MLLAEDDPSVRRLVVTELTRRGFTVIEAEDGAAALEMFRREKDRIDVLVTDVVMPRLNGADLAKAAERIRPGLKILFISGHPSAPAQVSIRPASPNLLMKPFTADTLAARIKDIITGRKGGRWLERLKRRPLRRALGKWDLTAIGVNQVIGSAIFLLPSHVARAIGPWGPLAFLAVGLLSLSIALCFAEVGQPVRYDRRPVSSGARRVRALHRLRSRLDDVVRARDQPRVGRQRPDAGAGVLLAAARDGTAAGRDDHRR